MSLKVGIVGAGILGAWTAWTLKTRGLDVTLFDQDGSGPGATSFAAGGLLCPFSELDNAEREIARLGTRSIPIWRELHRSRRDFYFSEKGSLVVGHPTDRGELIRFRNRLAAAGFEKEASDLSLSELRAMEPGVDFASFHALYFPNEAQLDAREAWRSVREDFLARSGRCLFGAEVSEIRPGELRAKGESFTFDWVVDCRGIGAKSDLPRLRGVRGERLTLRTEEVILERPIRLLHPAVPLYVAPLPGSRFIVGATVLEDESGRAISLRSVLELSASAYSLDARFAEAELLETVVSQRPAFPTHLPQLDVTPGLIRANGLFRHGFLVSPALAEEIASTIESKGTLCKSA